MRFKARLFPLIDVMILMLGLFLVILARATLTENPEDQVENRKTSAEDSDIPADASGVVVEYKHPHWFVMGSDIPLDSPGTWLTVLAERGIPEDSVVTIGRIPQRYEITDIPRRRLKDLIGDHCAKLGFETIQE